MENRSVEMQENWNKWNPENFPNGNYSVISFAQNPDGTKITLVSDECMVEVIFDGVTPHVRTSIEGLRIRTWSEVQKKNENRYFFKDWFLYIVDDSKLSAWVSEESCGVYNNEELTHYAIVTSEDIIDVISTFEPTIRMMQRV